MNIRKLPSGSYQISQMVKGKRYYVTVKEKPKKFEAEELINEKIYGMSDLSKSPSVSKKALLYITECENDGKSPTTTYSYRSIVKNTPQWFLDKKPTEVSVDEFQRLIDEYAKKHSAKSTRNFYGFYRAVFADIKHLNGATIKLPSKSKKAEYEPTTKDVKRILKAVEGSPYEIVIKLCSIGLRRGEAIAITKEDLNEDDVLTINKDIVYSDKGYIVKDHPKTESSNRRIKIPHNIAELIRNCDQVYSLGPNSIGKYFNKLLNDLDIPHFRFHILRHYAAAYLHKNGFTDRQIMAYMGWETASTMHNVYNYNLDPEESQKDIVDVFNNNF